MGWSSEFKDQSILRLNENPPRILNCLDRLDEDQVWQKPNSNSNSIGNLILHLCGNIRQYAISSLGNLLDDRERDQEFSASGGVSKSELFDNLKSTIEEACDVINHQSEEDLLKIRNVQGFELSGIGVIIHVVEHLSYHTGQIAYWTKILTEDDLGFYAGIDLNKK